MHKFANIAVIGAGNIGTAIAIGLVESDRFKPEQIVLTRRHSGLLAQFQERGFAVTQDNLDAVRRSEAIIIAVEPQQINSVLEEIGPVVDPKRHVLISVVSGVEIRQIQKHLGCEAPIIRAMPNTSIVIRQSMTCLASKQLDDDIMEATKSIFDAMGKTLVISEEQMTAATALGACGIAFFLRAIRAASQGGIEIGFHARDALLIAAQTALGAASLLVSKEKHPEDEIDKVTTPRGCTISGLNQMEHEGFSSAMIKGITTSANKASRLYGNNDD